MTITAQPLTSSFAAEIIGADLSQPIDAATVDAISTAIDRYAVVIFRDQRLTDAQLRDFAAGFGPLEIGRSAARPGRRRLAIPQIGDISNLDVDNNVRALDDRRRLDSLGNRLWHTDASYMPVPVVLGMLHAVALPPPSPFGNGETEFADMRAAYDALPEATQQAIDGLVVEHDVFWSRGQIGFTEFPPGEREQYPPSPQRLVRAPSRLASQDAVPLRACLAHCRLAGGRWPAAAMGPHRTRDAAAVRLQPHLARRRSGDLGQPRHHASRTTARRSTAARSATRHHPGYGVNVGTGRIGHGAAEAATRCVAIMPMPCGAPVDHDNRPTRQPDVAASRICAYTRRRKYRLSPPTSWPGLTRPSATRTKLRTMQSQSATIR